MQAALGRQAGRDRATEIDVAIDAVIDGTGPVRLVEGRADRRMLFGGPEAAVQAGPWARFAGATGELCANGDTLLVGIGDAADARAVEQVRTAASAAAANLDGGRVEVAFSSAPVELVRAAIDGLASGYCGAEPVSLVVADELWPAAEAGLLAADVVRLARLLTSAPAAVLTPERAADWAEQIAARTGLQASVRGPEHIAADGLGGVQAIGVGSQNGPRVVTIESRPSEGARTVALVGKGITFDSGGLSLKSAAAMQSMRMDVAGAATVLAVLAGLRRLGPTVNVCAVLPFAENLPGPGAVRPGDVVTAWNGTQIQVLDTDFEGRVVLADALALAADRQPDLLVDLATLTYQAEIALGPDIAAVFGREDAAVGEWLDAAARAGEPMWRLPLAERYRDQVRTPSGVRNHPLRDTGRAITAALFLDEFVPVSVPWVHCDMTGPAWRGDASGDGATGFGARTLLELLARDSAT